MTTEQKEQSFVINCDGPGCHMQSIGMDETDARESASLAGWKGHEGKDLCHDCVANPGKVAVRTAFGASEIDIPSPGAVQKGDTVFAPDGTAMGIALNGASLGQPLKVDLTPPEPDEQVGTHHAQYAHLFDKGDEDRVEPTPEDPKVQQVMGQIDEMLGGPTNWDPDASN